MGGKPSILDEVLQTLFPSNDNLLEFLRNYPFDGMRDMVDRLPSPLVPKDEYFGRTVEQLRAYRFDTELLFDRLNERFTLQRQLISDARSAYLTDRPAASGGAGTRPSTRKALLRSLLPFEDGDELVGRDQEVQSVLTIVLSGGFQFGVVWGRSGCGKTSLIRAGLLPAVRAAKRYPIYYERPTDEMMADPQATLQSWVQAGQGEDRSKPTVVVIDQLEAFFLRTKERAEHQRLADLIDAALSTAARPISFLLGIREDFFGKLHHLKIGKVPDPTKPATCYELDELAPTVAEEILAASVVSDGTQFSNDLIRKIADDLTVEGFVRPVELQIVGSALKQRRIKQENGYDTVGGARGLLQTYIKDEIASCPDKQMAALVLRRLCAEGRPIKSPEDVDKEALIETVARAGLDPISDRDLLQRTLERLIEAKLVVQRGENLYNLVHDFIASLIPVATAGIETAKEQANRLLTKYLAEYREDPKFRIPRHHLALIHKNADSSLSADRIARTLYFRSTVSAIGTIVLPVSVVAAALMAAYATVYFSEYLSTEPSRYAETTPSIVVRAGNPLLKILPGFDLVRVDTGYFMGDVATDDPEAADAVPRERLANFMWPGKNGYSRWADDLIPRLSPYKRVAAWRLLGRPEQALDSARELLPGGNVFVGESLGQLGATLDPAGRDDIFHKLSEIFTAASTPQERAAAATAIGQMILDGGDEASPETMFRSTFDGYMELANRKEAEDTVDLSFAADKLRRGPGALILAFPGVVREQDTKALLDFVADSESDAFRVRTALDLLQLIGLANPHRTSAIIHRLVDLTAADDDSGSWKVIDRIRVLHQLAAAHPDEVTSSAVAPLAKLIADQGKYGAVLAYSVIASINPAAASPEAIASIQTCAAADDEQVEPSTANGCITGLMRLKGAGANDAEALAKASASSGRDDLSDEDDEQSRRYLALVARPPFLPEQKRSALLSEFIGGQCIGSPQNILDDPDPYSLFYTVLETTKDVFKSDNVLELVSVMQKCNWAGSKRRLPELLVAAAKYQPDAILGLEDQLRKLDIGQAQSRTNSELPELAVAPVARADYERRKAEGSLSLQSIRSLVETRERADRRISGSYAAYLFWLDNNGERGAVERLLQDLGKEPDADVRMAANRAREMIRIARVTVAATPEVPFGLALARLQMFEESQEVHIVTAAHLALELLIDTRLKK
ncbi:hypothetical protein ACCS66_35465 [Rhizobium ruizarguesonis]